MIGQNQLINKLKTYNFDTFPHASLILGEKGSGKHLISQFISEEILHLPIMDITEQIDDEFLDKIYLNQMPMIYLVDTSKMAEKEQNVLLKFIEEPTEMSFVILLCESKTLLLDTVINRCIPFEMDNYSTEELMNFIPQDADAQILTQVLHTPGQILTCKHCDWHALSDLCNKMADKMSVANYSNTLSISNKINYKDEYDKFDLDIFLNFLAYTLFNKYLTEHNKNMLDMYLALVKSRKKLVDNRLNKQIWLENTLTTLWEISRNGH